MTAVSPETKEPTVANEIEQALSAMHTAGRRPKVHDAQMVFKLPSSVKALIKAFGEGRGESEGAVVRQALAEFFERRGYGDNK
jgi:hypothetical protein